MRDRHVRRHLLGEAAGGLVAEQVVGGGVARVGLIGKAAVEGVAVNRGHPQPRLGREELPQTAQPAELRKGRPCEGEAGERRTEP